jgi:hypothetical protein
MKVISNFSARAIARVTGIWRPKALMATAPTLAEALIGAQSRPRDVSAMRDDPKKSIWRKSQKFKVIAELRLILLGVVAQLSFGTPTDPWANK